MKGKIRVYCRVRPMLPFEKSRGQSYSINVPDEMTISHPWKEEKKDREYVFDSVFTPDIKQEDVSSFLFVLLVDLLSGIREHKTFGPVSCGRLQCMYFRIWTDRKW